MHDGRGKLVAQTNYDINCSGTLFALCVNEHGTKKQYETNTIERILFIKKLIRPSVWVSGLLSVAILKIVCRSSCIYGALGQCKLTDALWVPALA